MMTPCLNGTPFSSRKAHTLALAALVNSAAILLLASTPAAQAQSIAARRPSAKAHSLLPASNLVRDEDNGVRAHTNLRAVKLDTATPAEMPPFSGYGYETPASLACVYHLVQPIAGCNPNKTTNTPDGGSESIAIVDAYHDPSAAADLEAFSNQFGLAFEKSKFEVLYASGTKPAVDPTGGWELEESLDIEWAHAMAPHATIYLVETASNSFADLFHGVEVATNLVRCGKKVGCAKDAHGKGEVSMSWGGSEFAQESQYDAMFNGSNVVYIAAAGDAAGVIYPSASPNVIAAGGTTTARNLNNGDLIQEIAWSDAGGGQSFYEPRPKYQNPVGWLVGSTRAVPDISTDANPITGLWVYNSNPYQGQTGNPWWIVGGTSASSPTIAGILNAAATESGHFAPSTAAELTEVYGQLGKTGSDATFNDITYGACNYYSGSFTRKGYDYCTGVGSPKGFEGK